jgi:transketolase
MNELHNKILEVSKKLGLSHLGSCLTAVDIIDEIYQTKEENEPFILSCGHCGLALYAVIEKHRGIPTERIFNEHGTHPERCKECGIECSTGSLGHGLTIALGMALADRNRNVYCLISDGECFEGSVWEAFNVIRRYEVTNLRVYLNYNMFSAYSKVEEWMLNNIMHIYPNIRVRRTNVEDYGLEGLSAHYIKL